MCSEKNRVWYGDWVGGAAVACKLAHVLWTGLGIMGYLNLFPWTFVGPRSRWTGLSIVSQDWVIIGT